MAYDIYQQVFCLSMKICGASNTTGTRDQLQAIVTQKVTQFFAQVATTDEWEIAWGPVVWQIPVVSDVADQAMGVLYNKTRNLYQIAIAATNPSSKFDIFVEDLAVRPDWMLQLPADPAITVSFGNYAALGILLAMTPESGQPGAGQTVAQFFQALNASAGAQVVVSGHSLGGGLAPLLACSLKKQGVFGSGIANVHAYPTAAPTVADQAFATAFAAAFPATTPGSQPYQQWNTVLYNGRDIVPHAWAHPQSPGLGDITATPIQGYGMFWTSLVIAAAVAALQQEAIQIASDATGDPYVPVPSSKLFTAAQSAGQITTTSALVSEITYQHVRAYIDFYGVGTLVNAAEMEQLIHVPMTSMIAHAASIATAATALAAAPEGVE